MKVEFFNALYLLVFLNKYYVRLYFSVSFRFLCVLWDANKHGGAHEKFGIL